MQSFIGKHAAEIVAAEVTRRMTGDADTKNPPSHVGGYGLVVRHRTHTDIRAELGRRCRVHPADK